MAPGFGAPLPVVASGTRTRNLRLQGPLPHRGELRQMKPSKSKDEVCIIYPKSLLETRRKAKQIKSLRDKILKELDLEFVLDTKLRWGAEK
jgi:hypothetical protein